MIIPVLRTKISPPLRRGEILSRERLFELFDNLLDQKLIIITAPAGYGKTSLLIDFAYRTEIPLCWYTLDPLDQDIQRFLYHFVASIQFRFTKFGVQSIAALEGISPTDFSLENFLITLVNEIFDTIQEHFIIVLDDYHSVECNAEINEFVNRFLQDVDQNCHIIILSRSLLPLSDLSLMVARSQVGGIGLHELAFRASEIQALMLQNYHQVIPDNIAHEMMQRTEGWITGLLLTAQTMWHGMVDQLRISRVSGIDLYDYLIDQVLDQQPPELREFLLMTSYLDEFNAALCSDLLNEPPRGYTWNSILKEVVSHNLFVLPVGDDGEWLRYHHLFRDFLQHRLEQDQPDVANHIQQSLVVLYERHGELEKAYSISQRLGNINDTASFLERAAGPLMVSGRITLLRRWLEAIPPHVLEQKPILLARLGLVLATQSETEHGLRLLVNSIEYFRAMKNKPHLARSLIWRAFIYQIRSDYSNSLTDIDEALALTREKASDSEFTGIDAQAYRIRGQCNRFLGKLAASIEDLTYSLSLYEAQVDYQDANLVMLDLGAAYTDAADFASALSCYQKAQNYFQHQNNTFSLSSVLNDMAFLHHICGEYLIAYKVYEEALHKARQGVNIRVEGLVMIGIGDLYLDLDAWQSATDSYRQARLILKQFNDKFLMIYLDLAEAAISRLNNKYHQAHLLLKSAYQTIEQFPSNYSRGLFLLESGRLALAENDFISATDSLTKATQIFDAGGQRLESGRAWLFLAAASYGLGNIQAVEKQLNYIFDYASELEIQHSLVLSARLVKTFLQAAVISPHLRHKTQRLLDQVVLFESEISSLRRRLRKQSVIITSGAPHMRIQALGKAQVLLNRRPVTSAEWHTQVTRDLFFLILSEPRGWTKEGVGEILWPDCSPSQLKFRFKNTIYHLRRALEQDVIVYDGSRYTFNQDLDYEYDVEKFWELNYQAIKAQTNLEKINAYQEMIQIYQGDYLPEVGGIWIIPEREHLRQVFLEVGIQLAKLYLESQRFDRSIEISHRLMKEDNSFEEIYIIAMQANAAVGNYSAITNLYQKVSTTLLDNTGLNPSAQIEELYHALIK
jgi:LuxR family maltose regulon positive regulatory protein